MEEPVAKESAGAATPTPLPADAAKLAELLQKVVGAVTIAAQDNPELRAKMQQTLAALAP